jgi:hypothetical protein
MYLEAVAVQVRVLQGLEEEQIPVRIPRALEEEAVMGGLVLQGELEEAEAPDIHKPEELVVLEPAEAEVSITSEAPVDT